MPTKQAQTKTGTLRISRVFKAPPERIWRCFTDPDAYAKWCPPHGFTGHVHHMDAKVGGTYRMSFNTIDRSWGHTFGGRYVEMKPYERLVFTNAFEGNDPVFANDAEMRTTITFKPVKGGTEVTVVQEGLPPGPAADGAPVGWGQSLDNLQRLVEQELPF
ncbi:MAG: SRPBCC domain-containing protein [Candidatus Thermoplasmatota archaeon]